MENKGVTYPKGFFASGISCGIKKNNKKDVAMVYSPSVCTCAGVFTKNVVKGHSLQLCQEYVQQGKAKAVFINSGNANACIGKQGHYDAIALCEMISKGIDCEKEMVLIGSTGVIGVPLPMDKIARGINKALESLKENSGSDAAEAIMTTDTYKKEAGAEIIVDGQPIRIGAMAKGSGMIYPNMATMISVITTDIKMKKHQAKELLKEVADMTYNRVCVDGDTSVCDKVLLLANGKSNVSYDKCKSEFKQALIGVCTDLAKMLAHDGEGATKLITINIKGAKTFEDAKLIAHSIAKSPLCKTAAFGEDANWGRLLTAAGYSGAQFDPDLCDVYIGDLITCKSGNAIIFDEAAALEILKQDKISYTINLNQGEHEYYMWTCDMSIDYIKINADYRT
ncbi:MAG: bifunctional glutamate N-acetyltransferase/amino-acid acetyltransferase ArgJ [Eubacteriales bacterium]